MSRLTRRIRYGMLVLMLAAAAIVGSLVARAEAADPRLDDTLALFEKADILLSVSESGSIDPKVDKAFAKHIEAARAALGKARAEVEAARATAGP